MSLPHVYFLFDIFVFIFIKSDSVVLGVCRVKDKVHLDDFPNQNDYEFFFWHFLDTQLCYDFPVADSGSHGGGPGYAVRLDGSVQGVYFLPGQ